VIIQVTVRAMAHFFSQLGFASPRIGVMPIAGDSLGNTSGDSPRGAEEGFRRRLVALLTQQNLDEIPIAINRPVQVGPRAIALKP
jgi:hypothetical protein